jgi:hypothetical protein
MLRLARTLGEKLSHSAPGITEQEQDVLLKRLYFGEAETVQAASVSGLITIGTEADKPVEPVFLMDPSLVATHNNLHQSLHQSKKHLEPPSRYDKYTQTRQMFTLAKAIDDNNCKKDPSISKWESFLGSKQVTNDHPCQPSMGMFTESQNKFEGYPSYVIPHLDFPYPAEVTDNPKDTNYLKSSLTGYDKDLTKVNSDLRKCLSNIIFVDMVRQHSLQWSNPADKQD